MKKEIIFILSVFCSTFCFSQNTDNKRKDFIDIVAGTYSSIRRDCFDCCDYYIVFRCEYNGIVSDYITMDDDLKVFLVKEYKISFDSATLMEKEKLLSNDIFKITKNFHINLLFDIWEGDSIFNSLKNDKDKFLNYYFNTDSTYKYGLDDYVESNNNLSVHNKIFKATAITKQLYIWNIPVYGCNNSSTMKYGRRNEE